MISESKNARAKDKGLGGTGTGISGGQFTEKANTAPGASAGLAATRGTPGARMLTEPVTTTLPDGVNVENRAFEKITTDEARAMSYGGVCDPGRVRWAPESRSSSEVGLDPRNIHFSGGPFLHSQRACEISGFARTHDEGWRRLTTIESAWSLRYDRRPHSSLARVIAERRNVDPSLVTVAEMDDLALNQIREIALAAKARIEAAQVAHDDAASTYASRRFAVSRRARAAKRDALVERNRARHALLSARTDYFVATELFDGATHLREFNKAEETTR